MTSPAKLNEYNSAEEPARLLLERLGWTFVPRQALAAERGDEREVLLKDRLRAALLRLNQWMTEEQADRAIFELEHVDATGMLRNQRVHEYLTYGMPLTVDGTRGRETRTVRFFDFDHPEGGLNEFVVTTQFRVRRSNERGGPENDERMVIPDLVLFVNGIPLVVMEAKSPSLLDVWKTQAVRQLQRYQEARPEWYGAGAPELFHYNLLCVAHCGAAAVYAALGAPETAYFQWKSVLPYSEDEVRQRFGRGAPGAGAAHHRPAGPGDAAGRPAGLRGLRAGARAAGEEAAPLPAAPGRAQGDGAHPVAAQARRARRRGLAHPGLRQIADDAVAGDEAAARPAPCLPRPSSSSPTGRSSTGRSPTPSSGAASRRRSGWTARARSPPNASPAVGRRGPAGATRWTCRLRSDRAAAAR